MEENKNELVAVNGESTEVAEVHSGMPTGAAMLIGGGLALTGIAGVKKLRKVLKNRKDKKYAEANAKEDDVAEDDFDDEE